VEIKKSAYIESTVPSYGSAKDSFNILNQARKKLTNDFWSIRDRFTLWLSQTVIDEISGGDKDAAIRRLDFVKGIEILPEPEGLNNLADIYQHITDIPDRAKADCVHLAYCVLLKMDYLVSWNMTHLGPESQKKIHEYNEKHSLWTPILVTPEILYNKYLEGTL
jgi:hypothetical protein